MIASKKGLESYLLILAGISFVMAILLFFVLSVFYGDEHENCTQVNYEIVSACIERGEIKFTLRNEANKRLLFQANGISDYEMDPISVGTFIASNEAKGLEILPLVTTGVETFECSSKVKKLPREEVRIC